MQNHKQKTDYSKLIDKEVLAICNGDNELIFFIEGNPQLEFNSNTCAWKFVENNDILLSSANYVKVGGYIVYSTCTVLPRENAENIKRFLSERDDFEAVEFTVGGKSSVGGMLSLSPDTDHTDGFFISKMKRKG